MNINDYTDIKYTPLHFAVYYGLKKIVGLLVENFAKLTIKTKKEGETPLHIACKKGYFEIAEILLNQKYGDINFINETKIDGKTGLHLSVMNSSLVTKILLKYGANLRIIDNNGFTPYDLALIYGREDIFNISIIINIHLILNK